MGDDRYKVKRSNMKHYKKVYHRKIAGNESSSSQVEVIRGVIDVADSSDDRNSGRPISWSPRAIESELEANMENQQLHAADFGLLTQMPASVGGHFKFNSEKSWDAEDAFLSKSEATEYFILNLNLISAGLQTIAFYKRLDLPSLMFSKTQIKAMNQAAEIEEKKYQITLKEYENNLNGKVNTARNESARSTRSLTEMAHQPASGVKCIDDDKELDEFLNIISNEDTDTSEIGKMKSSNPGLTKNINVKVADDEEQRGDIRQWLDDVLQE